MIGTGPNADYTSSTPTFTFDASTNLQCFDIPITDDDDLENDEQFTIGLTTTDPGVELDPENGEVLILNDDGELLQSLSFCRAESCQVLISYIPVISYCFKM